MKSHIKKNKSDIVVCMYGIKKKIASNNVSVNC